VVFEWDLIQIGANLFGIVVVICGETNEVVGDGIQTGGQCSCKNSFGMIFCFVWSVATRRAVVRVDEGFGEEEMILQKIRLLLRTVYDTEVLYMMKRTDIGDIFCVWVSVWLEWIEVEVRHE
jgi:hypothetical protein